MTPSTSDKVPPGQPPFPPAAVAGLRRDLSGEVAGLRLDYGDRPFDEADLGPTWTEQFGTWLADAISAGLPEPNAMIVATAAAAGVPSARTVLLRGYAEGGFVFFTNYRSRKGVELIENPRASLVFPWFSMQRQVVVCGSASQVPRAQTEAYFASRPRESQVGAWASAQSSVLPDRAAIEESYAEVAERFPAEVPPPPHWGGFRVAPETVEFWQGRTGRLHDRLRFRRTDDGWITERLAP